MAKGKPRTDAERAHLSETTKRHWQRVVRVAQLIGESPQRVTRVWGSLAAIEDRILSGDPIVLATARDIVARYFAPTAVRVRRPQFELPPEPAPAPAPKPKRKPPERRLTHEEREIAAERMLRWAIRNIGDKRLARNVFNEIINEDA